MTKQKKMMHDEIQKASGFFDAIMFHSKLAKKEIGIATVYRFLNELEKKGEIHAYMCDNRKIYSLSQKNHVHFTCEHCGKMEHLHPRNIDFLRDAFSGEICHFQINVAGVCKECVRKL
jgi:Fe2+ or Zn2+ uptake regulation protein